MIHKVNGGKWSPPWGVIIFLVLITAIFLVALLPLPGCLNQITPAA